MLNNKLYETLVIMMKVLILNTYVLAVLLSCEKQALAVFCNNKDT